MDGGGSGDLGMGRDIGIFRKSKLFAFILRPTDFGLFPFRSPPRSPVPLKPLTIMKNRFFTLTQIRKTNGKIHLKHKSYISAWKHAQPMIRGNQVQIQQTQNPLHFDLELIHYRLMTRID